MVRRMNWFVSGIALVSLVLLSLPAMAVTTWQPTGGPEGVVIYDVAIDPTDSQTVYVGAETGGVYKTSNGGVSWNPANSGLPRYSVYSLIIDPANHQTIYAAMIDENGNGGGIYKSIDGGGSWQPTLLTPVSSLAIDPADSQTLYAGTLSGGVIKSGDGGSTWALCIFTLSGGDFPVIQLAIDPTSTQTIYAVTYFEGSMYKSTNGGVTWQPVIGNLTGNSSIINTVSIDPSKHDGIYIGTEDGVYKSINGGISWSQAGSELFYTSVGCIAIDPSSSQTIYASVYNDRNSTDILYKSTDGGDSWHEISNGLPSDNSFFVALAIAPTAPQTLYGGYTWMFKTMDGGNSWNAINKGLNCTNVYALAVEPGNSQTIYAGSDTIIYKSTDGGNTWSASKTGLKDDYDIITYLAVDPVNTHNIYAGTYSSGVIKSIDGGVSWSPAKTWPSSSASYNHCVVIDPSNPQIVYTGTYDGAFKSVDGGDSWSAINGLNSSYVFSIAVDPTSSQTIYAGTGDGVFKSINGGASWSSVGIGTTGEEKLTTNLVIDPVNSQTIYAGTGGGIFKSTDGGETWTGINTRLKGETHWILLAVNPINPLIIYVHTSKGMFATTNGGESWSAADSGLNGLWVPSMVFDSGNSQILYAGTEGRGVLTSLAIPDIPTITTAAPLPSGTYNVNYNKILAATGATKPYTWSVVSGDIPAGITFDAAKGALKGKPTGWGDFTFTVQVADKYGYKSTKDFTLSILVPPLTITTTSLPCGKVGSSYKKVLAGKGGVKPYAWSVSAGALPGGLALDAATGTISGKPTAPGAYSFTIRLMDESKQAVAKEVTLMVK